MCGRCGRDGIKGKAQSRVDDQGGGLELRQQQHQLSDACTKNVLSYMHVRSKIS